MDFSSETEFLMTSKSTSTGYTFLSPSGTDFIYTATNQMPSFRYLDTLFTHLEPDILECEVKWALGSITTNKGSGGDGIPVVLFQILKDDAVKVLHSICQQTLKLSSDHRTGKCQFSFQR